ncbi:hypothetical protein SERLA73DRAFT_82651 [Serpula lacrymans var. lacrymans S7.3]|uniref:Uncharacterized protein n=1 Tax=Serpula lacrymans var. lacrymans (strain S7.3) TaxID=936435 RepID=F8PIC7_SERL3|nr:hypothetical protein SERLA73DRAFT_82651 [Serpula lacrymans var. lacrymans S7.3]
MGNTPASPAPARTIRPVGSISSIREVREDGKNLEELQKRLKEAVDDLSAKSEAAAALEEQVAELKASLDTALADTDAKGATISELEAARDASVSEIEQLRESHVKLQEDREKDLLVLETVQNELENAKAASFDQTELIETLQDQIAALETQVSAAKDDLDVLRAAHDNNSSDAAAAAQIEREALLKAKADLEAIGAETEALRASHSAVLEDLAEKLRDAEDRASGAEALEREVAGLKAEKDENASKLSELEIEILELRESQDQAEDEHSETISRLQKLEEELAQAAAATQQALDDAQAKEEEHALQTQNLQRLHDEQLQAAKDDLAAMATSLQALESQLTEAYGAHEQTRCDAEAAADEHTREIEEAEQAQLSLQIELSEEIKRITAELEGQEAQYNAKVDAVKAEHDILLQEAFERAKNEAGSAHGEDLQGLRAESQATIEQLRSAHQSTIEGLKAEHEEVIQSTVGDLDKRLNSQALDLRATQDDLAKAKAALDASRAESESLKAKLEDARAAFISASASPDQAAEIERLSQEIANIRDENVMLSDVLAVTKVSLTEMSTNHTRELEEAAKSRVEEVTKLRAAHESEITDLATQKSEIALKLSDLDGELATLKASLAAEPSNQKSNGTMHTASPQLTVPKEDLQRAHEAHNMKLHDMRAEFDRLAKALREENEMSQATIEELRQEVGRKNMEIQYLEQEQEESQDHITRLKEDMETLAEQHKPMEAVSTA